MKIITTKPMETSKEAKDKAVELVDRFYLELKNDAGITIFKQQNNALLFALMRL